MTPTSLDSAGLHAACSAGLDPAAVIEAAYDRLEATSDPGIFITLVPREAALGAARALPPFDPVGLPLWGLPFAVKDNIDVAGLPTTAGCPDYAYTPAATAFAVERLLAAGAILIGKTNLDQFATGLVGVRTPYPVPRNPFDPTRVPGGSSSGSAVAVARGIVAFALGTDTAGSGRVPAALNNLVGLKPSLGAVSTRGIFPACRTLDCVSVFAPTVDDAWRVYAVMAGEDAADPYSRPVPLGSVASATPHATIGVPDPASLSLDDDAARQAWTEALRQLEALGASLVPVDLRPFFDAARLLYGGPWVAERHAAIRRFLDSSPEAIHPVTRRIIEGANAFSATDAFEAAYRLAALKRGTEPIWRGIDALAVPSVPCFPTLAELEGDPYGPNARLGLYTNFVNLLDLAALAVPGPFRPDGLPAGVTLIGPRGSDARLAALGRALHASAGRSLGVTTVAMPALGPAASDGDGLIEIAVVGAHLSGMPLNRELTTLGGVFRRAVRTQPTYRLYALAGGAPKRPGLLRAAEGVGVAIETEVWALPLEGFGRFVAAIPSPLGIGTLDLADGTRPKGFLVEPEGLTGAEDISDWGGWRAFVASVAA